MNRWDVEGTHSEIEEGQFTMGSGDSGGETRLQHGSPAGTKVQDADRKAVQEDSSDKQEDNATGEGGSETERRQTGLEDEGDDSSPNSVRGGEWSVEEVRRRQHSDRGTRKSERGGHDRPVRLISSLQRLISSLQRGDSVRGDQGDELKVRDRTTPRRSKELGGSGHDRPAHPTSFSSKGGEHSVEERNRQRKQRRSRRLRGRSGGGSSGSAGTKVQQTGLDEEGDSLEVLLEQLVRLKESFVTVQGKMKELLSIVLTRLQSMSLKKGDGREPQRRSRKLGGDGQDRSTQAISSLQGSDSNHEDQDRSERRGSGDNGMRGGGYRSREDSRSPSQERGDRGKKKRKKKSKKKDLKVQFEESSSDSWEGSIPISREKHLEAVRKVPALANRKNPLKWLLAYKRYARSRKWGEADYCHMLPLVWDNQLGGITENWFEGLSKRRRSTPLKLEQAFVRKFAQEYAENFIQETMHSVQGEGEWCEDWFIRVYKQFKQMREWVPKDVPSEERFLRVMVTRFTDHYMLVSLNDAQGLDETESSADGGGSRPVLSATKIKHICKKADRLRRRLRRLDAQGSKRHQQLNQSRGGSLVDGMAVDPTDMYGEGDENLERTSKFRVGNEVHNLGGIPITRSVGGTLAKLDMPTSGQIKREGDLQDFRNVVGRLHEPDHKNQVCGFHACTLRGCNMGDRCAHAHEDRVNVKCEFYASPVQCPHGIFCRRRHLNEEYGVWLRDGANSSSFRFAIWKDQKSRFRREPREAQTQE